MKLSFSVSALLVKMLFVTMASGQTFSITDGLLAYYPLDGNASDKSGGGRDGQISEAIAAQDRWGNPTGALHFNGTNSLISVQLSTIPVGNAPRTVSVWARSEANPSQGEMLIGYGVPANAREFTIMNNGGPYRWAAEVYGGGLGAYGPEVSDQNWHAVAATYSGSTLTLYFDGVPAAQNQVTLDTGFSPVIVGNSPENSSEWFKGSIDDVRIYNRALSADSIKTLYEYESTNRLVLGPHRARATAEVVNGFVVGITLTDSGSGYATAPDVEIVGGAGSGATAIAQIENGSVTKFVVVSAGSGYTETPIVSIAPPPGLPTIEIAVSKVRVRLNVTTGKKYILESSVDLKTWSSIMPIFVAASEVLDQEFDVSQTGRYFRVGEVQ